jgi:type II secretory pathway pseudopilin PulG
MSDQAIFILVMAALAFPVLAAWTNGRRRPRRRTDTEVILDAIDGVRQQVDNASQLTALEHENQAKATQKIGGRIQFLIAKDIAAELGAQRDAEAKKAAVRPKDDVQ